jgi:hypothetical protein
MNIVSHSEDEQKKSKIRQLFFPDIYALVSEIIVASAALILFNTNDLSNKFLQDAADESNPFSFSFQLISNAWSNIEQIYAVQQTLIFILWAVVGALVYILFFRMIQLIFGIKYSIDTGVKLIRNEKSTGLLRWFSTLHDVLLKSLVTFVGLLIFIFGAFICFGIASQELRSGLIQEFPSNIQPIIICLISAFLSVRLVTLGLSLLSVRFRNWYIS